MPRCHDHKFDPIPTEDYYSLYGVFASSVEPRAARSSARGGADDRVRELRQAQEVRERRRRGTRRRSQGRECHSIRGAAVCLRPRPRLRAAAGSRRTRTDKIAPGRLRGLCDALAASTWRRAGRRHDPVFAPWHAFAALPGRRLRRQGCRRWPGSCPSRTAGPSARGRGRSPTRLRRPWPRSSPGTDAAAEAEARWQESARGGSRRPSALEDADWEALRQVLYAENGPIAVGPPPALIPRPKERTGSRPSREESTSWTVTHPGAPAAGDGPERRPQPVEPAGLPPRQSGRRQGGAATVPRGACRAGPQAVRRTAAAGSSWRRRSSEPDNPLTARVMVNRIWLHHFGRALVGTPSDFGLRSDPPTHPELLDYLAGAFVRRGWSIKAMHRLIMLSNTYQQRSDNRPECARARPGEPPGLEVQPPPARLRGDPRRLAGRLRPARPDDGGPSRCRSSKAPFPTRRTIYGFIDRQNLDGIYRTFDFATPTPPAPGGT